MVGKGARVAERAFQAGWGLRARDGHRCLRKELVVVRIVGDILQKVVFRFMDLKVFYRFLFGFLVIILITLVFSEFINLMEKNVNWCEPDWIISNLVD